MKKFSTLLLSLALGSTLAAQTPKFTPDRGALLDGKTIVKANITSPIFKNYSFAAERILTKGLSLQLGIATMPKGCPALLLVVRESHRSRCIYEQRKAPVFLRHA